MALRPVLVLILTTSAHADVIRVDSAAPPGGDGQSWATAFTEPHVAFDRARPGDEVWLAHGPYRVETDSDPCAVAPAFQVPEGIAVRGGFIGTEIAPADRPPGTVTRLDAAAEVGPPPRACCIVHDGPGCSCSGCPECDACATTVCAILPWCCDERWDDACVALAASFCDAACDETPVPAVRVIDLVGSGAGAPETTFERLDIVGGLAPDGECGAGARVRDATATFRQCRFEDNRADGVGGGLALENATVTLDNVLFHGNTARSGGAVAVTLSTLAVHGTTFTANAAEEIGGAVAAWSGDVAIDDAAFAEVTWTADRGGYVALVGTTARVTQSRFILGAWPGAHRGGAIDAQDGTLTLTACRFTGGAYVESEFSNSANDGGAVRLAGGQATVEACVFDGVRAWQTGGALLAAAASVTIRDCAFRGNAVFSEDMPTSGGAMMIVGGDATIRACTFDSNRARSNGDWARGGALHVRAAASTVHQCTFRDNHSDTTGGAVALDRVGDARLEDCAFESNTAESAGGAVYNQESAAVFARCAFHGNAATLGGATSDSFASRSVYQACAFLDNSADDGGAGRAWNAAEPLYVNSIIAGNTADRGGALLSSNGSRLHVVASTLYANRARIGAGVSAGKQWPDDVTASIVLTGCILTSNRAPDPSAHLTVELQQIGLADRYGRAEIRACLVEGWTGLLGGAGNRDGDPRFVDGVGPDGVAGTADDDLRLDSGSDAIDAGDNHALPPEVTVDFDGAPRFVDDPAVPDTGFGRPPIVDMGAFERSPRPPREAVSPSRPRG